MTISIIVTDYQSSAGCTAFGQQSDKIKKSRADVLSEVFWRGPDKVYKNSVSNYLLTWSNVAGGQEIPKELMQFVFVNDERVRRSVSI